MLRSGVSGEKGSRDDADTMRKHREQWLLKMQHKLPRPPQDRNEANLVARRSPDQGIGAGLEIRRTRRPLDIATSPKSPETKNTARDETIKTLEDARCQAEIDWKAAEARVRAELGKAAENELLALRRENVKILNELAATKGEVVVVRKQAMQAGADKRQSEEAFDHKLRKAHAEVADLSRARARDADRIKDLQVSLTERARENAELEQKLLIKRAAQAAHVIPLEKLEAELASQKRDIKRREDAIAFQRRQQQTEVEVLRQEIQQLCEARDAANKRIEILTQDASKVSLEKLHERLREQERANAELGRRAERDRQLCVEFERKVVELSKHESAAEAGNIRMGFSRTVVSHALVWHAALVRKEMHVVNAR
ncbi:Hypothetical Protein FCC1311_014322 [Hondaea fermentalgiana]|uniref:Uncharacterized protein n=1 Tax=Hondaea fermentalgiana TaxID=2315210 RepID=A0A2R5G3V1_9STRA|nr:Hypothetical Protein FCC1311_014322 [Hondaea fermentalgiana]|eukprot:GBG25215.1 Hypothetical Protein FCC1311_014322 [Hondaea fermentalgiana]